MKNKGLLACMLLAVMTITFSCKQENAATTETDFAQYVDQYIGTGGHGHVFMGANVPFGLVQLGPTSIPQKWDWCSGYHITDTTVIGFGHMHLNGTGIGDLSDIILMPTTGDVNHNRGTHESYDTGMWSYFSRANEKCEPGYYATHLDRYNVDVELTATPRVGFHKYQFAEGTTDARVVIDLENGLNWDKSMECKIEVFNENTIGGYRYSKGWADDQRVYFVAEFSKPFKNFQLYDKNKAVDGKSIVSAQAYGEALFADALGAEPLYVKVALSPVSVQNARMNMLHETPELDWDFNKVRKNAYAMWNEELSKVKVKTTDASAKKIFYTALFHTMVAPSIFSDVNGQYRGADAKTYSSKEFTNYTTFSLWDTYRAAHPLMTIIHPEKMADMVNTMIHIYEQQGKLPVWHLMGCETNCMVGNPGISVVADAMLKGFEGFDKEKAYEAMKTSAMLDERGLKYFKEYGYIPYEKESEGLSKAMEYAIADWALAQVAKEMGKTEDYNYFLERSKVFERYFDKQTGFVRGLSAKGEFRPNFNPFESIHRDNDYTEGNAWQYTWLVPHDIDGLVAQFGSKEAFITKLDSLFIVEGELGEHASPDISGLIGQYAHGNEPSHHIAYMYTHVGQPWKTANVVRQVLSELYHDQPDGLSGNEDVGQMSAWYVLSSLGLYQVEPAGGRYYFGSPIMDEAVINVGEGKTFTIEAKYNSSVNKYIQAITLNGQPYTLPYLDYAAIAAGGTLEIEMGDKPAVWYEVK
ncbi:MAG: GH92 family glycosyl hydrolase [Mangrovibacterium sp.]